MILDRPHDGILSLNLDGFELLYLLFPQLDARTQPLVNVHNICSTQKDFSVNSSNGLTDRHIGRLTYVYDRMATVLKNVF